MTQSTLKFIVVLLGVIVVGLAGTCAYQYFSSAKLTRDIAQQEAQLVTQKRHVAQRVKSLKASKQLTTRIEQRPLTWSWSDQLPVMMTQVGKIVEKSAVKLDTVQPAPVVERQQLARFPLRLTVQTDLAHLAQLLQETSQAAPLLAVDRLAVRAGQKVGDPLQVELTLSSFVIMNNRQAVGGRP